MRSATAARLVLRRRLYVVCIVGFRAKVVVWLGQFWACALCFCKYRAGVGCGGGIGVSIVA